MSLTTLTTGLLRYADMYGGRCVISGYRRTLSENTTQRHRRLPAICLTNVGGLSTSADGQSALPHPPPLSPMVIDNMECDPETRDIEGSGPMRNDVISVHPTSIATLLLPNINIPAASPAVSFPLGALSSFASSASTGARSDGEHRFASSSKSETVTGDNADDKMDLDLESETSPSLSCLMRNFAYEYVERDQDYTFPSVQATNQPFTPLSSSVFSSPAPLSQLPSSTHRPTFSFTPSNQVLGRRKIDAAFPLSSASSVLTGKPSYPRSTSSIGPKRRGDEDKENVAPKKPRSRRVVAGRV